MDVHPDLNLLQNQRWYDHPNVCEMMKTTLTSILDAPGWFMKGAPSKLKTYAAKIQFLALQNTFCWFDIPPLSHYLHGIPTNCHHPKHTGANPRCLAPIQDNPRCLAPTQDTPTHFCWNTHFWCYHVLSISMSGAKRVAEVGIFPFHEGLHLRHGRRAQLAPKDLSSAAGW